MEHSPKGDLRSKQEIDEILAELLEEQPAQPLPQSPQPLEPSPAPLTQEAKKEGKKKKAKSKPLKKVETEEP